MAYTDDWENLMNGVFGAGGRPRFGGTAQPESKTPKAKAPAVPDLNAALLENQKQLDALLKKQNAQLKTQDTAVQSALEDSRQMLRDMEDEGLLARGTTDVKPEHLGSFEGLAAEVKRRNSRTIVHVDAVQAWMRVPIKLDNIDTLAVSGHKIHAPKGIGALYVKKGLRLPPLTFGGGQEKGMRSGTENVAGIYSMAKALEDNVANMESIHNHISELDSLLCTLLVENEIDFSINGDSSSRAAGILNIAISGIDGEGLLNMLDMHDICISIGSACNSKSQDRSHVLLAMGLDEARIDSSVRISIGRYNTEDDIRTLVKWIANYHKIAKLAEA